MDNEFENLLAEYLDGDADAASATRLCEMLKDRPDLQKRFREEIRLHTLMREIGLQEIAGGQSADLADPDETGGREYSRMPWRIVLSLAAVLLLAVGAGWWMLEPRFQPDAGVAPNNEPVAEVSSGKGEKLTLKFDSEETVLEMGENTVLKLPGCEVSVGSDGSGRTLKGKPQKVVEVVSGVVNVVVAKQQEGRTFVVKTGQAELAVVGTRFSAVVSGRKTRVSVKEGIVRVSPRPAGSAFSLLAGMSSDLEDGRQATATIDLSQAKRLKLPDGNLTSGGFVYGDGLLWIAEGLSLAGYDAETVKEVRRLDMSKICYSVKPLCWYDGGLLVYTAGGVGQSVLKINPKTGDVEKKLYEGPQLSGQGIESAAVGDGSLWIEWPRGAKNEIARFDLATGTKQASLHVNAGGKGLIWRDGGLWRLEPDAADGTLRLVDRNTGESIMTLRAKGGAGPTRGWWRGVAAAADGSLWFLHILGNENNDVWHVGGTQDK